MKKLSGFSLMEMMVVLLIVSIVAAASAPMVNKKLLTQTSEKSPWVWSGVNQNIAYNLNNTEQTASIGTTNPPAAASNAKLYIDTKASGGAYRPQIAFGQDGGRNVMQLTSTGNSIWLTNTPYTNKSGELRNVVIGASANASMFDSTVIGYNARASAHTSTALGERANTSAPSSTAIGVCANASGNSSTAIGSFANALGHNSIALGSIARANYASSTAIGLSAYASGASSIALGSSAIASGENSTALGSIARASGYHSTALGEDTIASGVNSTAVGTEGRALGYGSTAVGLSAYASGNNSTTVGKLSYASGSESIAIGLSADSFSDKSIALGSGAIVWSGSTGSTVIGYKARSSHAGSTAIGSYATTTATNQIVLGRSSDTVYIPGKLVVGQESYLGTNVLTGFSSVWLKAYDNGGSFKYGWVADKSAYGFHFQGGSKEHGLGTAYSWSDKRLKNVGKAFTSGLDKIRKLEVFNYTFKEDKSKTPRVGVMAQDLQKIFPDAVIKGEDGFLRIRMEDMFYALVNAVKENDSRITALEKENKELKKRIADLEKKIK